MGEPLATLPPSVPRVAHGQAGKAVRKAGQLGPVSNQRGERVGQGDCRTNGQVVGVVLHAAQFGHPGGVDNLRKLLVHFGDPQAHVGATGHQLRAG